MLRQSTEYFHQILRILQNRFWRTEQWCDTFGRLTLPPLFSLVEDVGSPQDRLIDVNDLNTTNKIFTLKNSTMTMHIMYVSPGLGLCF